MTFYPDDLTESEADALYLNESANLSDLDNVATARTNLGLVAGGAGDIWVKRAGDPMTGDLVPADNVDISLGGTADLRWDTTDANANFAKLNLPAGGAVDVPVFAMGVGLNGVDLGLFNGTTQTTFVVVNSTDTTEYTTLSYNPTSGFGGTGGQAEWSSTGDAFITLGGSLALTAGFIVRPATGLDKNMRVSYRAGGTATQCRFEFGEQGISTAFFFTEGAFDQSGWGLTAQVGRQMIISDSANWSNSRDLDIPVQSDPIFVVTSALNWNTDHGETVAMNHYLLARGSVTNTTPENSTFAMETDRVMKDWEFHNVNAYQNASNTTHKDGNDWYFYGSDGNILHTGAANGGDFIFTPGLGDDGEAGRAGAFSIDGAYRVITTDVNAANYTVLSTDHYLQVRRTATGACALTLPAISRVRDGFVLWIEDSGNNAGANNITVNTTGGDTIEFAASPAVINTNGTVWRLQANLTGTNWKIT